MHVSVHVSVCVCVCVEKEKIDFSPQLRGSTAARLNLGGAWE